jgi:hypothetical protein
MAIRLNQQAVEHAQNFIKDRQYERNSDWSEAQPSAQEESYIAVPPSQPNSVPAQKTTTMSKAPPTGCWRCCLAKTTSKNFVAQEAT